MITGASLCSGQAIRYIKSGGSGLAENWEHKDYGQEETVVDWFAVQGPKIYKAWTDAGAV